jgi:hypothetical protein
LLVTKLKRRCRCALFHPILFTAATVRTIPYSDFKNYLARDEVTEAVVKQDEIDGLVVPRAESQSKTAPAEPGAATVGSVGADLANLLNEAALLAARRRETEITQGDLEEAIEKVVAGPERKSRRLDDDEKRRVAYHETGHALVAAYGKHADPVHKISIVPRGRAALGYTMQLPDEDRFLLTRGALVDRICGMLGLAYCAQRKPAFLDGQEFQIQRDCSEQMASTC